VSSPEQPTYLQPYSRAVKRHGPDFRALLWASRRTQEQRFEALAHVADPTGLSILDLGCGYGVIGLAIAVFVGRNWARLVLMFSCVSTTTAAFIGNANGSEAVTLATSLPTVGISIMVLLALSSHRAREYAARGRHIPKRIAGRQYEQAAIG